MKEVKAYRCGYCKKYSTSKSYIAQHEKECYHRPEEKACATCGNLRQIDVRVESDFSFPVYSVAPMCSAGIPISKPTDRISSLELRRSIRLRRGCERWVERVDE